MNRTILIVEASIAMSQSTGYILEQDGYVVLSAKTGNEGIQLIGSNDIDLVIMDDSEPRIKSVISRIRELDGKKSIPILLIANERIQNESSGNNGDNHLSIITKPFSADTLIGCVRKVLS